MVGRLLKALGGILAIVAVALPVATFTLFETESIPGHESDLEIVAILGGIIALSSLGKPSKSKAVISLIFIIIGASVLINLIYKLNQEAWILDIGLGVIVAGIGLILAVIGAIREFSDAKKPPKPISVEPL